jgi:outer membrane protein assembly factor BamB
MAMQKPEEEQAPARRSFWRFWLPWVVLGAAAIAAEAVWIQPSLARAQRIYSLWIVWLIVTILLTFWVAAFSGLRWWLRICAILIALVVANAADRQLHLREGVLRIVGIAPASPQDEALESHRRQQGAAILEAIDLAARPGDCPGYRGTLRDGIVTGPPLARDWSATPPQLVWRQPIGAGLGSFAVVGNVAITLEQRRDREAIVCYDKETGRERWVYTYPAFYRHTQGNGPRSTPTIDAGNVFTFGATGKLVCLDGSTGRLNWSLDTLVDNENLAYGLSGSPLVYDHFVVVNPGAQCQNASGRAVLAYKRSTGNPVWQAGTTPAGYSSPMLATLAGVRQVVLVDGETLAGYDAATGKQLWHFPWNETHQGINVAQPVVLEGDRVFISSGYSVGCALVQVTRSGDRWTATKLWRNTAMHCKFSSPVPYQDYLYGLDEGILVCVDAKTGKRMWKSGRYGNGQMLRTDDLFVILSEKGQLVLVQATPKGHHELAKFQALEGKTWNVPALVDGRIYLRSDTEMACYDLRADGGRTAPQADHYLPARSR